jgi:hypothetical protein
MFDEYNVKAGYRGYANVVSILPQVDETDKKSLFNLRDLGDYHISDTLLNYIEAGERFHMVTPYKSFMYISLQQDGKYFNNDMLEIDSDLNVKSKVPLQLMKPVRVTIAVSMDISYLSKESLARLYDQPEVLYIFLAEYINAYNNFKSDQTAVLNDNTFYREILLMIKNYINADRYDVVINIFKIISEDKFISCMTGKFILAGSFDIYKALAPIGIIKIDHDTFDITIEPKKRDSGANKPSIGAVRSDMERMVMKTVMTKYIEAGKME